jgi:dihydropteroate synthase
VSVQTSSALVAQLCGAAARRLAPRVLDPLDGERVRLAYRKEGLTAGELAVLAREAGSQPATADGAPEREWIAELAPQRVEELALEGTGLELLWAAVQARSRPFAPPRVWGVLNVTPDSFSDGGRYLEPAAALERAERMVAEGAHGIDVGGESTRPGAQPLGLEQELERVVPVIAGIAERWSLPLSVDTTKAEVARAALERGANAINDVSAGRFDAGMLPLAAQHGCDLVLMHLRGTPRDMQVDPLYGDVVSDVLEFLRERAGAALEAGVAPERLWIDPGIGFGKTLEHNLELLRRLGELRSLGLPLYVGVSRKSFIGKLNARAGRGGEAADERLGGTAAAVAACVRAGAEALRVHDVAVMAEAARVARAIG